MRVTWRGVFPAATTQFAEDGSVDLAATGRPLDGDERARITAPIHRAIETRPAL